MCKKKQFVLICGSKVAHGFTEIQGLYPKYRVFVSEVPCMQDYLIHTFATSFYTRSSFIPASFSFNQCGFVIRTVLQAERVRVAYTLEQNRHDEHYANTEGIGS